MITEGSWPGQSPCLGAQPLEGCGFNVYRGGGAPEGPAGESGACLPICPCVLR